MSNPTVPFVFQYLDPETTAVQIDQDYEALISFMTTQLVHVHHLQFASFAVPAITGNTNMTAQNLTWPVAFPAGVVPSVYAQVNNTGTKVAWAEALGVAVSNVSNTGCTIDIRNMQANNYAGGGVCEVTAIDPTFDTSA